MGDYDSQDVNAFARDIIAKADDLSLNGKGNAVSFVVPLPPMVSDLGFALRVPLTKKIIKSSVTGKGLSFVSEVKRLLPEGLKCDVLLTPHKQELGYETNPCPVTITLSIQTTQDYRQIRYNYYYSKPFEQTLIINRKNELNRMVEYVRNYSSRSFSVGENGLSYDEGQGLRFADLGLKPLTSISQIYTLASVITDMLNLNESEKWIIRLDSAGQLYQYYPDGMKISIVKELIKSDNESNLCDW